MRVGLVANAYNEARFLPKFLKHIPDWVEEKLVLITDPPWYGDKLEDDGSKVLAENAGAIVLKFPWPNEHDQRNAGQSYFADYDWVLTIEPDEFLSNDDWRKLHDFLLTADKPAYAVKQHVLWGKGYESDPPEDFVPIIVTRPTVEFTEKRNVNSNWTTLPDDIKIWHFAWARSDEEIWKKISHYSHAVDFDIKDWYENVWLARKTENVHPTTPEAIPRLIKAKLPPELEALNLWPK